MSAIAGEHTQTVPTRVLTKARLKWLAYATLGGLIAFAGARYGHEYWSVGRFIESTDDAYAGGNVTPISPHVAGFVAQILVGDNEYVRAGQPLIRLDDRDFRAAADRAAAIVEAPRRPSTASSANGRCNKRPSARRRQISTPRMRKRRSPSRTIKDIATLRRPPPDRGKIPSARRRSIWRPKPAWFRPKLASTPPNNR